jgi:hypothetical protein
VSGLICLLLSFMFTQATQLVNHLKTKREIFCPVRLPLVLLMPECVCAVTSKASAGDGGRSWRYTYLYFCRLVCPAPSSL